MQTDELLRFLAAYFAVERYPLTEQGGIFRPSDRVVQRLGLALEVDSALAKWVTEQRLDALWLHRPWQLTDVTPLPGVGVIYHHLPFDETLTMGFNQPLAESLGLSNPEALGYKQTEDEAGNLLPRRAIGMIGNPPTRSFAAWQAWVKQAFGGYDQAEAGRHDLVGRVAVVGAMNNELIREAADRGADLYLTGQYRKAAQEAVDETGMAVIAVGHRRSEEWGLRTLAFVLREQFPQLVVEHKKSGQPKS